MRRTPRDERQAMIKRVVARFTTTRDTIADIARDEGRDRHCIYDMLREGGVEPAKNRKVGAA